MRALPRIALGAALAFGFTAGALACGSDDGRPSTSTGSSSSSGGGPDGGDASRDAADVDGEAGVSCASVMPGKPKVLAAYLPGVPPDDIGGAVTDGTYDLTGLEEYVATPEQGTADAGPADGEEDSAQATLIMKAAALEHAKASTTRGVLTPLASARATFHVEGVSLVTERVCPDTLAQSTPYTIDGATLTLHVSQTRREIYTRRP
ncbi:MAG: hypothetical protein JWP97_4169 [Labilithrix sp.]|nr:hypothetical protein [Labilithrix sp.]